MDTIWKLSPFRLAYLFFGTKSEFRLRLIVLSPGSLYSISQHVREIQRAIEFPLRPLAVQFSTIAIPNRLDNWATSPMHQCVGRTRVFLDKVKKPSMVFFFFFFSTSLKNSDHTRINWNENLNGITIILKNMWWYNKTFAGECEFCVFFLPLFTRRRKGTKGIVEEKKRTGVKRIEQTSQYKRTKNILHIRGKQREKGQEIR